jgi:VCBS repeat-containing protein
MNNTRKIFTVSALVLALSACNDDGVSQLNIEGGVSISGTTTSGDNLTATVMDVNGVDASAITYQWMSGGAEIAGATSSSYLITDNEVGSTITVAANYTDNDNFNEAVTSEATNEIEAITVNVDGTVAITGTAESGQELTATITDDNGVPAEGVTYAWLAGTDTIGTDASTVTLTDTEIGKTVTVTVTYTDDENFSENVTSEASTAVTPVAPTPAEFAGDLTATVTSSETAATTGTIAVTDINTGEATFQELTDITTTYGTFSITTAGTWTYTLDSNNATVSSLTSTDPAVLDTITLTSFDNTTTDLVITITGADLVPNNVVTVAGAGQVRIVVTDTDAQLTDAGIGENNGKLTVESGSFTFRFNAQDVGANTLVALFGGKSNTPRPVLELRFDEGKLLIDDNTTGDLIELTQTYVEDTWNDVEITWDTTLATTDVVPTVTLSINGTPVTSLDGTTITTDTFDAFTTNLVDLQDGINMVKIIIAANADAGVDTDRFKLDDIKMVNNDVNAPTAEVFDADFEDLAEGDEITTGNSSFNSATSAAFVETVLEQP